MLGKVDLPTFANPTSPTDKLLDAAQDFRRRSRFLMSSLVVCERYRMVFIDEKKIFILLLFLWVYIKHTVACLLGNTALLYPDHHTLHPF